MQGLKHLFSYSVMSADGEDIGKVEDFFVNEQGWAVSHLVVRTGGILSGEHALVPSGLLQPPDADRRCLPLSFDKADLAQSVGAQDARTVSAEIESAVEAAYGRMDPRRDRGFIRLGPAEEIESNGSTLRSVREITGYHIETTDGPCGICTDLLADTDRWVVSYLVVNTKEWRPHGHVLAPVDWITSVSWQDMQIEVRAPRSKIQAAQRFDPASHDVWRDPSPNLAGKAS